MDRKLHAFVALMGCLFVLNCTHTKKARRSPPPPQTQAGLTAFLEKHGIDEGIDTVLYHKVLERVRAMPYLAIYDANQVLLYEKLGYDRKAIAEIGKVISGHSRPLGKNLRMLPLKNLDGSWFDPKKLSPAKFYIYEFWSTWCKPCIKQMKALRDFLATSPYKGEVHLIRVFHGRFEFPERLKREARTKDSGE